MSFGLTFDKLLIIGIIAVFLIGPDRLPQYAAQLARLVRSLRDMANGAKSRMREEMGPEFDEVDWAKLDPRQYDPRRIIRDALLEDTGFDDGMKPKSATPSAAPRATPRDRPTAAALAGNRESAYAQRQRKLGKPRPSPFDTEAT